MTCHELHVFLCHKDKFALLVGGWVGGWWISPLLPRPFLLKALLTSKKRWGWTFVSCYEVHVLLTEQAASREPVHSQAIHPPTHLHRGVYILVMVFTWVALFYPPLIASAGTSSTHPLTHPPLPPPPIPYIQ